MERAGQAGGEEQHYGIGDAQGQDVSLRGAAVSRCGEQADSAGAVAGGIEGAARGGIGGAGGVAVGIDEVAFQRMENAAWASQVMRVIPGIDMGDAGADTVKCDCGAGRGELRIAVSKVPRETRTSRATVVVLRAGCGGVGFCGARPALRQVGFGQQDRVGGNTRFCR